TSLALYSTPLYRNNLGLHEIAVQSNVFRALQILVSLRHLYLLDDAIYQVALPQSVIGQLDSLFIGKDIKHIDPLIPFIRHLKPSCLRCQLSLDRNIPESIDLLSKKVHSNFASQFTHVCTKLSKIEDIRLI